MSLKSYTNTLSSSALISRVNTRRGDTKHQRFSNEKGEKKMFSQVTSRLLMIESSYFNYNPQTPLDNTFQVEIAGLSREEVRSKAIGEFFQLANKLTQVGVEVNSIEDIRHQSEDAVFPNNWISFHEEVDSRCQIVLYPMMSERRRLERRDDVVLKWKDRLTATVIDFSKYENEGKFLEGTGSMVLDRVNRVAYTCKSKRTHKDVFEHFCRDLGYYPMILSHLAVIKKDVFVLSITPMS